MSRSMRLPMVAALLATVLLSPALPVAAQSDPPTLYEVYRGSGAGNGTNIYGDNWAAQSFLTTASHTATLIRLPITVQGDPLYVEVALRAGNQTGGDAIPSGGDIVRVTLDGADIPVNSITWIDFPIAETLLEIDTTYCIVLRAPGDSDASNYVEWRMETPDNFGNGTASASVNGGYAWTADTSMDYYFEIWGETTLLVKQAEVFSKYLEPGDMLFCAEYVNTYPPYYDDYDPAQYFQIQLIGTDHTTVLATAPCRDWGDRPASMYLSASSAASLQPKATYYVRLQATFGSQPYAEYQLTTANWRGKDLDNLKDWCVRTAKSMADYDGTVYTVYVSDKGNILNGGGGVLFDRGIPMLSTVLPDLFQEGIRELEGYPFGEPDIGIGGDWETVMGPEFVQSMEDAGNVINLSPKYTAAALAISVFLVLALVCAYVNSVELGMVLATPALAFSAWAGFLSVPLLAILIIAYGFLFVTFFWWRPT